MRRPVLMMAAFGACLVVLLAAVAWVSVRAVEADRAQAEAERQAAFEEKVRLALWRMDSALAPLVAMENSRPYFAYSAPRPAGQAGAAASARVPEIPQYVLLYFQFGPDGRLTSPQTPAAPAALTSAQKTKETAEDVSGRLERLSGMLTSDRLTALIQENAGRTGGLPTTVAVRPSELNVVRTQQAEAQQVMRNAAEWQAREQAIRYSQNIDNTKSASMSVSEGVMKPVWVDDVLMMARRVRTGGEDYLQGCWLDWPAIERWLVEDIKDLFPAAELEPVKGTGESEGSRMLAALPVRLVPGTPGEAGQSQASSALVPLFFAWACTLLAAGSVAALMWGAVQLSARRGAFVSAVTHELRTPLTTFRMYAEMLAEDMVPAERRKEYIETLHTEAERLTHLVENVLAYARLERSRGVLHLSGLEAVETVTVGEIVTGPARALAELAQRSGMELVVELGDEAATCIRADKAAVERILFNLVDNACKYASSSGYDARGHGTSGDNASGHYARGRNARPPDRRIHLECVGAGTFVALRVRDHGPGVPAGNARRLFRPFSKSANDAANSAPGVGLGLSLSRRLARNMGGDLRLDGSVRDGAAFVLTLPVQAGAAA